MQTIGISQKAVLAAVYPLLAGLVTVVVNWAASGVFDGTELKLLLATALASLLGGGGAYKGDPGDVVDPKAVASDDLLAAALNRG
jgi:hypothetical protein